MRAKRVRRGSTLVMVGIMMVAFVGVGAIAADIGRFYVVTSEVQTAADAAAIAGARKLQLTSGTTPGATVTAAVVAWVPTTQRANMTPITADAIDVQMLFYTPGTNGSQGTLAPAAAGQRPNAVRVTLGSTPRGFFAQLLGQTGTRLLKRTAVAWVASLPSNCVKPWAFPYLALYQKVMVNPAATSPAPDLDPIKWSQFIDPLSSNASRMFTVIGQNQSGPGVPPNDGEWTGFNFTGNAGKPGFTDGLQACATTSEWYTNKLDPDAGQGVTLPGQAGQYVTWSNQAIQYSSGGNGNGNSNGSGPCAFKNPAYTADCYATPTDTLPGVTINSAWGELLGNGSNGIDFKFVGEFQMLCYYRGPSDKCSNAAPGTPDTGYPAGTVVGYIRLLKSRYITLDDVLGNYASNVQKIILVQ